MFKGIEKLQYLKTYYSQWQALKEVEKYDHNQKKNQSVKTYQKTK